MTKDLKYSKIFDFPIEICVIFLNDALPGSVAPKAA